MRSDPGSQYASRSYYQIGATYFLQGHFERSVQFLGESLPRITDARQHAEAEQLIGLSYLKQKRWSEASEVFKALQASAIIPVREKAEVYHNYAERGAALPTRSPFLAGTLSTVVPGAGRLYTGRFADALNTLFTVGITVGKHTTVSVETGFHRQKGGRSARSVASSMWVTSTVL